MHYTTIDPNMSLEIRTLHHALHHHWPPNVKDSNPRPLTQTSKIRTHDHALRHHWPTKVKDSNPRHALHHHWPPKVNDSNPRRCTTPPLMSTKRQRFEPKTMHYAPLLTTSTGTSTAFIVIDDVTAHVNPKHLVYDEAMCHSDWRLGVKRLNNSSKTAKFPSRHRTRSVKVTKLIPKNTFTLIDIHRK
jgi:hypothetical protein